MLRSALTNALSEELISTNVAGLVRVCSARKKVRAPWSVDEARKFLESARRDGDLRYPAYVLILVLGLRCGEVLGLSWSSVDLSGHILMVEAQLQRIRRQLVHDETKTEASTAALPWLRSPPLRCDCAGSPRHRRARPLETCGRTPTSFSPRGPAPRSNRGTSTARSPTAATVLASG